MTEDEQGSMEIRARLKTGEADGQVSLEKYHCDLINAGLRAIDEGRTLSHEQVLEEIKTWGWKK
jgi:predicted transcriptional regulator